MLRLLRETSPMHLARRRCCRELVLLSLCFLLVLPSSPSSSRAEEPPPKVDLAELVQKRKLSSGEILAMVKAVANWPIAEFGWLPAAFHVDFHGTATGPSLGYPFDLQWGRPYFRTNGQTLLHGGSQISGNPVGQDWTPGDAKPVLQGISMRFPWSSTLEPHVEKKAAVRAIAFWAPSLHARWTTVAFAFRKGRVSLRQWELIERWGKPTSIELLKHRSPVEDRGPGSKLTYEQVGPHCSVTFFFYTAKKKKVPLVIECTFSSTPPSKGQALMERRPHEGSKGVEQSEPAPATGSHP
ncbi:hypothetical protein [Methylacidimicrobium sp. B4]|uniref:hypothetical protein n=1 Tax=Methylacidimicrobium sp. B4 TaxID=2796139 RepID=UPI001A8C197A|nr:hypothetical protein [Methylacidimicrobium sp. B4]QSR84160.1 hypothetical protein MacB4_07890 [Methylacidimicrobium sp. B4]